MAGHLQNKVAEDAIGKTLAIEKATPEVPGGQRPEVPGNTTQLK